MNTVVVVCVLGLVCALAVTAVFAAYYYSSLESDMRYRARSTMEFFADYLNQNEDAYYESCIKYAQTFEDRNHIELQFIDVDGSVVASSQGNWVGDAPTTPDIAEAVETRDITSFVGKNPQTGERIMAVSSPMVYRDGEVIGVLRYVTSTDSMDRQIISIGGIAMGALIVIAHKTPLDEVISSGDEIDAGIHRRLIMNLFFKNSPLHDGALVIANGRIAAARCTLPITQKTNIPANFGMRHKAAIGITEESDADVIVVSEETGNISFVKGGVVTKIQNINELKLLLGESLG